jgi:uncharacterized membrane protein
VFGPDPEGEIEEDLKRFKDFIEKPESIPWSHPGEDRKVA